ncbi:hypothetical protein JS539_07710 [Bifidobacterium simiarum]|nr:hypothetical protein [Bifidobacterium simiarum]
MRLGHWQRGVAAIAAIVGLVASLAACGGSANSQSDKTITLGATPGPYAELFKKGVQPILEKEGYTVQYKNFNDPQAADDATERGLVDLTVTQHRAYMQAFNKAKDAHLVDAGVLPSLSTGLYSDKQHSLKNVKSGDLVLVPQDSSNLSRALVLLSDIGWISLNPKTDIAKLTPNDIVKNPHNLNIKLVDRASVPRNLPDADWGVICGQPAYNAKVDQKLLVAKEHFRPEFLNRIVIKDTSRDEAWVKAVANAYHSKEFKHFLETDPSRSYWYVPEDNA